MAQSADPRGVPRTRLRRPARSPSATTSAPARTRGHQKSAAASSFWTNRVWRTVKRPDPAGILRRACSSASIVMNFTQPASCRLRTHEADHEDAGQRRAVRVQEQAGNEGPSTSSCKHERGVVLKFEARGGERGTDVHLIRPGDPQTSASVTALNSSASEAASSGVARGLGAQAAGRCASTHAVR